MEAEFTRFVGVAMLAKSSASVPRFTWVWPVYAIVADGAKVVVPVPFCATLPAPDIAPKSTPSATAFERLKTSDAPEAMLIGLLKESDPVVPPMPSESRPPLMVVAPV